MRKAMLPVPLLVLGLLLLACGGASYTPKPASDFEAVTLRFSGTGADATDTFHLDAGLYDFHLVYEGEHFFDFELRSTQSDYIYFLRDDIGRYEGHKKERLDNGVYWLEVDMNDSANWSVTITREG